MYRGLWVSESDCTILIKGERIIDRSWIKAGIVSSEVGTQGNCSACWAWVVAEATQAALNIAGKDAPPLSPQEIINNNYKGRKGCRGGQAITALQWIVEMGIGKENACRYEGTKCMRPPPLSKERYFIDGWKVIDDDESKMIEALDKQPVIVSIPYVSGVENYETGLLDLNRADALHERKQLQNQDHPEQEHTVLLVEKGHIIPDAYPDLHIDFWVIKNQWKDTWGNKGFADIIFTSSLIKLKEKLGLDTNDSDWFYTPLVPFVKSSKDEKIYHVDNVRTDLSPNELKNYVEEKPDIAIIVLLYHSTSHDEDPKVLEELRLISAMYDYHKNVVVARIDLVEHPNAAKILGVRKSDKPILVSFPKKEGSETRSLKEAKRFPGNRELKFANMVDWLETATGHALEQEFCEVTLNSEED